MSDITIGEFEAIICSDNSCCHENLLWKSGCSFAPNSSPSWEICVLFHRDGNEYHLSLSEPCANQKRLVKPWALATLLPHRRADSSGPLAAPFQFSPEGERDFMSADAESLAVKREQTTAGSPFQERINFK